MGLLDEYYKEREEKFRLGLLEEYALDQQIGDTNYEVNQDFINSFFTDAKSYLDTAESDYGSLGWSTASPAYESRNSKWLDLYARSSAIRKWLDSNKSNFDKETYSNLSTSLDSFVNGAYSVNNIFKSAKDEYAQWETEDAYNAWYEKKKKQEEEFSAVLRANDFDKYYLKGNEYGKELTFKDKLTNRTYNSVAHMRNDPKALELYENSAKSSNGASWGTSERILRNQIEYKAAKYMTNDEFSVYNYYFGKDMENGTDTAEKFLESIEETLNIRAANEKFADIEGRVFQEILFGISAGLDKFETGLINLFDTKSDYIPASPIQMTSGMVREDLADNGFKLPDWMGGGSIGQMVYDIVDSTSNMLPSIFASAVANSIVPGSGRFVGAGLLGASASGNAYAEMLNDGYDKGQARSYSLLVGASEAALQYALGGISKLGGKVTGGAVNKFVSSLDNAIAKVAIKLGGSMASEGLEEAIQTAIEPVFKAIVTGEDLEAATMEDILYSALLGSLSAGVLEGGGTIAGEISADTRAKKLYGNGSTLIDEALSVAPEGSGLSNLATKYKGKLDGGKSLSGSQIVHLDEAMAKNDIAMIKAAVETRLTKLGETENVSELADILTKQATGEKLSLAEKATLKNSKFGQRVSNELNAENIKSGEYSSAWAEEIGTRRVNPEVYNKNLYDLAKAVSGVVEATEKASVEKTLSESETETVTNVEVSDNGKTMYYDAETDSTTEVEIKKIVSTDGGIMVELDNGKTASIKDVRLGTQEEGLVYEMISRMNVTPETANVFLNAFKPGNVKQASMYFTAVPLAYRYGQMNYEAGLKNISLSEADKRIAFNQGRMDAMAADKANTKTAPKNGKATTSTKKGGIIFEGDFVYDESTANELQKASMAGIEVMDKMSNLEFHVFKSRVVDGKRVAEINGKTVSAPNGYFVDGNKVYIDFESGNGGEGAMLYTMSHEVLHYIRKWNPKGFRELADFLIAEFGKQGVPVNALLEAQKDKIKKRYTEEGKPLPSEEKLFDMAYEELVADAMSDMLTDPKAYEKLAKLKQKNRTLWEKLGEAIKALLDKIKNVLGVYKTKNPAVAREAMEVRGFSADVYNKLQDLYLKAFAQADNNYSTAEKVLVENGVAVNPETESASLMSVRDVLTDKQREKVSTALATRFGVTKEEAMNWLKAETSMASLILNPKYSQYLDYTPDPNEVAIKTNSDYPQGTVDFSPICAKRREFTSVMNNILRVFPNHVFAATDLAKIRTIMQEEGMTIPCGICYVEDRRQLDTIVAQNFIDSLKLYREGSKTRPDGKPFNANQLKGLSLVDGDNYTPSVYELVSLEGLNVLKEKNPNMAEAWVKFNNARGMQAVRLLANEAEYKRQILSYTKKTVQSKNDKGGLRVYSFSDAEMFHLIDIIQVITDSATVGLSLLGYTKVNEYARAVKDTGEKLNRSLIPKGELGYHIEDGKVVLDYDTVEGIDINHPDFFDNRDNPNVGNITIGVSDVQIRAAMVSDFVDQIIPFHTGQSEDVLGEKGIATWTNYKDFQTEKDIATGKVSEHQINIYTEVLQVLEREGKPINKRTFVEKFLQVCKDNGLTPRFSQFLNVNENGEYVYTEGYHKLLVDFKTFAQTEVGEYLPQMPVKPIFDNAYITKVLKDYVKSQKVKDAEIVKSMPRVIERITNEIVKPGETTQQSETMYSDRDPYSYEALTSKPDMKITTLDGVIPNNRADVVLQAKKNAASIGKTNKDGSVSVYVKDVDVDVVLSKKGLLHGLDRRFQEIAPITVKAGEILQNSIKINELTPSKKEAEASYILIGVAQNSNGELCIVRSVVNKFSNELDTMDVLYAINAKKSTAVLNAPLVSTPNYRTTINIAQLLDFVNSHFPDILPEAVLRHYGYVARPEGKLGESALYSDRDSEGNALSAEQQEFFKDSKVRDKKGNLMVVYHGTTANFNTFRKGDVGFHFGTKGAARGRVGFGKNVTIKEVYLNITNPIVFDEDLGSWDANYMLTKELYKRGILTKEEAESVLFTDDKLYHRSTEASNKRLASVLLEKGYDGIAYQNTHETKKATTSYIVFNSNQAKEVTNKTPTSNPDIRYSDREIQPITDAEYEALKKHFGVTSNFKVAGYLLPDGKMLDFSGKHWGDTTSKSRQVDHRDAQEVLERGNNGINDMVDMIGSGSIRLMPETGGINLAVYPNEKQRRVLSLYIKQMLATEGQVIIDYDAVGGDTVHSREYGKYSSSTQILSDIRNYFNGARQSELMSFHTMYSDRDSQSPKPRSAQAQRDAGYMLNETKFYQLYSVHKLGLRGESSAEVLQQIENIKKNGFKGMTSGVNLIPSRVSYNQDGTPADYTARVYAPREGEYVLLVPESFVDSKKFSYTVKNGFKPFDYEIVKVERDYQPYYELYEKAYNQSKGQVLYSDRDSYSEGLNESDKKLADEVVNRLREQVIFSKYGRSFGAYTDSRIEREIEYSSAKGNLDYAKSYIVWVEPDDFINATTTTDEFRERLREEAGDLDVERLANQSQPIYLNVDFETGQIVGHEGRHRMLALQKAGVKKVAVIIDAFHDDRHHTKPISTMRLKGQKFESYRQGTNFYLDNMLPLSERYAGVAREVFAFDPKDGIRFSDRDPNAVSNRTLLANALESVAQNDIEKTKLSQYKEKIALIESEQAKLTDIKAKIRELSFAKGARDTDAIKRLQFEANEIENRINTYDKQLLNLESTSALKGVLEREKTKLRKRLEQKGKQAVREQKQKDMATIRELMTRHTESRKKAIEGRNKTEMRHKIKNVVSDLNRLLLNPTNEQHVPIGLQKVVAEALDAINMDTMNAEERVAYYNDLISKSSNPDEIKALTSKRDFFAYRDMTFKDKITALKNAYAEFKESEDPLIRNAHNDAIEDLIKNTADAVGNNSLKDMSYEQLEAVYDMYKAILATVRNSNKMFKEARQATVTENSEAVKTEVKEVGGHKDRVLKVFKFIKRFGWNMLKPVTAMKVIGSNTFAKLFDNVRTGEDTWAVDVSEAKQFYDEMSAKYGYKKWDFKKRYTFKDILGTEFSLSLEQIMSLYAYSKREQADKHLEYGGFIFDDAIEVTDKKLGIPLKYEVNDANPYRLRKEDLIPVLDALTTEQKGFIDEMQAYLSDVMGAKGNEVSLALYDIKLYKEKNYFPLKTARYFREFDPEKSGTPKIKNSGFSKKTVPQAGNPIVLSNFMDVWAQHVNDMSMYHAFVLPLEDFMRVYNYSSTAGGYDSVQQYIKNAYGTQANQYIERLMDDLNGGARVDPSADIMNKGLALFKKASVFASASVVIQQPSAIARAFAYINPKYFVTSAGSALNLAKHKSVWAEMKKYAPVVIIKEMGYFDTGMGRSTVEWIKGNDTIRAKMDDVLSKAPAIADELTWSYIWLAVKNEIKSTTSLTPGSEEFLKRCGERFTEIITNTQVYDSVLARSGMMRSKDTGMKMATAFMAEPTTTVNMMVDGIVRGKRGNKKFTASTVGAVSASIILNSILVSLVYAARDDDEDETYAEKYIGSLTSELLDGFNPLTYIPFLKDIWSIAQGYDVERSDMSVVSNLWESIEGLFNEDKSGWEKVADAAGSVSSLFGIPLKNLIRDAKGMYNLVETLTSGTPTTGAGITEAISDAVKSSIPLFDRLTDSKSNSDRLYEAIISGDQKQINRVKSRFDDEKDIESAMRKGLRENDSRIREAAQARLDGNISEYTRIAKAIIAEGHFSQDIVVGAINAEMSAIKKEMSTDTGSTEDKDEVTSIYAASDANEAFNNGDTATALQVINDLIETKTANGMTEKEAKSSLRSSMTSYWKPLYKQAYQSGNTSEMARIRQILYASGLYGSGNDVVSTVQSWLKG